MRNFNNQVHKKNGGSEMFCSKCGTECKEGASFCFKCGFNLQENANVSVGHVENEPVKQKKMRKKWVIAVIAIFLVIGGSGVAIWQSDMLSGNGDTLDSSISNEITRGYDKSSTAEDVLAGEADKSDVESTIAFTETSEDTYIATTDVAQIDMIGCEGGCLFGIEADEFSFYFEPDSVNDDAPCKLDYLYYHFPQEDYDEIYETISQKYEKYKTKSGNLECWNTKYYRINIFQNDSSTGVQIVFLTGDDEGISEDGSGVTSKSASEAVKDVTSENINDDITRGYTMSTAAAEVMVQEEERGDTTLIGGSYLIRMWDDDKGIFVSSIIGTNDPEEMNTLEYKGGKLWGIEAESIEFRFYDYGLAIMFYTFTDNHYDEVEQKISKEYEGYKIVKESGEGWFTEDYNVMISDDDDGYFVVRVYFEEE